MHIRNLLLVFFLFNISVNGLSQGNVFRFESQVGTFSMTDLKDFQERLMPDLGVNVEKVSSFPPYVGFGLSWLTRLNQGMGLGLTSEFFSTGGRNSYEDYSGYYKFDFLVHCFNLGTIITFKNELGGGQRINFEVLQGLKISSLTLREMIFISEPVSDEKLGFKSRSWWIKAGLRYEYDFLDYFTAGVFVGGEYNIGGKLESKENPNNFIFKENGEYVRINWSGLRAGISLAADLSILSSGKQ